VLPRAALSVDTSGLYKAAMYYILCLERTSENRRVWWKAAKMGYTENIREAGLYTFDEAIDIAMLDLGNDLPVEAPIVLAVEAARLSGWPTSEVRNTESG
jgi:hypothetical protein